MKNKELAKTKIDERTGIEYHLERDYYVPNIVLPEQEKVTLKKYGRMRLKYLKEHKRGLYTEMKLVGELYNHLSDVDEVATRRIEKIIKELAVQEGITEELKAKDQMKWVQSMNNIKNRAEEIVLKELIYH